MLVLDKLSSYNTGAMKIAGDDLAFGVEVWSGGVPTGQLKLPWTWGCWVCVCDEVVHLQRWRSRRGGYF